MDLRNKTRFNTWYWIGAFFILMVFQSIFTTVTQVVVRSPIASSRRILMRAG